MRRSGRILLAVAVVVPVVLVAGVWFGQRALMYHPDRSVPPPADQALPGARDVTLTTTDGLALGGWYAPPPGACTATVLVASGNGGNRAGRAGLARAIGEQGFGVLLFDYRGYGGNAGSPSERGLALDVRAARTFLLDEGAAPESLVYLGESMGTGVVSELAVEHPPAALVLRSPMTSFGDVVADLYGVPVGWVVRDRYPVREDVAHVAVPTAVVLGTADTLVPPAQSREVARTLRDAGAAVVEVEVPGTDHNDPALAEGDLLMAALVEVAGLAGIAGCA